MTRRTVPFAHAVFAEASSKAEEQVTHRDIQQLLNGQHVAVLHAHHGHIVQAVKVGQALQAHTARQTRTPSACHSCNGMLQGFLCTV